MDSTEFWSLFSAVSSPIVAGAAAIAGAYFTIYYQNKSDNHKLVEEKRNLNLLVNRDLSNILNFLKIILSNCRTEEGFDGLVVNMGSSEWNITKYNLGYPLHFRNMPFEKKSEVFEPDILEKLEDTYSKIEWFRNNRNEEYFRSLRAFENNANLPVSRPPYYTFARREVEDLINTILTTQQAMKHF